MALLHLQHSHQAETLPQLCPHHSPIRFGMLAIDGKGFNKAIHIPCQKSPPNTAHLLAQDHFKQRPGTESMATILMRRRWRWIGHVTRQEASFAKTALHWIPEGKRRKGRPKITWRRRERWERPGVVFQSWRRTGRSGRITLLPTRHTA